MKSNPNNPEAPKPEEEEVKQENPEIDPKKDAPPQVIDSRMLKIGDYQLHIYIEETRGLTSQNKEASSTIDPLVKIQAFDTSKHSKTKENRGSGMIYWGEHFFFTKNIAETSAMEFEKLNISVYDHNILGSDALLGEFELDLISIYFSENHSLLHQWIALSNYKTNFEQIQGFLKFSANCVGPEDVQIPLQDEEAAPEKDKKQMFSDSALGPLAKGKVLMPPQIHTKGWQLQIKLIKGENLVKMDSWGGSIDSYLVISFGNVEYKTEVIKDNVNPVWGQNIFIPFSEPSINDHIIFKLYDWDMSQKDELVGSACFSKKDVLTGKYSKFFWLNIYGSQSSGDSKVSATMNNNPNIATLWKGRILLSMEAYKQENPKLSSKKIPEHLPQEIVDNYVKKAKENLMEWCILVEIHYGLSFPSKSTEYQIEIRWADQDLLFPKSKPKGNLWEWYTREKMKCIFPYNTFEDLPDVFIYLKDGSNRICYFRESAAHFISNLTEKPQMYFFKPELSKNPNFKFHEAGIIKMRCTIGVPDLFDDLNVADWNKEIVKPVNRQMYLFANIYHAKNMIPADDDGSSDPYYSVEFYGCQEGSPVVKDTLNPIWYKTHKMVVPYFSMEEMPPIIIKFFDKDLISDEYMGHKVIWIKTGIAEGYISYNKPEIPEPQWINISYDNDKIGAGKVLLSFIILDKLPLNYEPSIYPLMEKYHITLRILGLRNLKSLGLFPVKRPFISFDINSLRPPGGKQSLKEKQKIETQPKESGSNPNLSTLISFEIDLPKDYTLSPTLNCVVYDCILKGLKQPVLGHFSIELDVFIKASRERIKKKIRKYSSKIAEKNAAFSQFSDLIQQKEEKPRRTSSPIKEIELSSEKETGLKEPLIKQTTPGNLENIVEKNKKLGYATLGEEKNDMKILDLEAGYRPKVILDDGSVDSTAIIRRAQYEFSQVKKTVIEVNVPDASKYIPIGYDPKETRLSNPNPKRHYRYFLDTPLETSIFVDKQTFDEFEILRGKRFTGDSLFSKISGETKEKSVGLFKGWVDIMSKSQKDNLAKQFSDKLLNEMEANRSFESLNMLGKPTIIDLNKEFMERTPVLVRVYMISATSLAQLDEDSLSDPYLVLKLGEQMLNNEKEYQTDKTNCDFNKMFEFKTILPGASLLNIQVWDKDFLVRDDLIGETFIDLENRYFSKRFRKLSNIPIETRALYHPLSKLEKGRIRLWVEIIPVRNVDEVKMLWDLTPRPPCNYELRVVVWEVENVPSQDIEDCSDLYVTALFNEKQQKTDTHFRAQKGAGSFNWRMVWDAVLPLSDPTITFQVWDKDFFSPNDFIAEATLSFQKEAGSAYENENIEKIQSNKMVKVKQKSQVNGQTVEKEVVMNDDKFVIELINAKKSGYVSKETLGKLTLGLELIPKAMADASKVGLGRNEPNHSPWLPPPVGRFEFSWNPLTLFNRLIGPKARRKVCICICVTICTAMLFYLLPTIFGNLVSIGLRKIF